MLENIQVETYSANNKKIRKSRKAGGLDGISGEMVRNLPVCQIRCLTRIMNAIVRLGYYPKEWKTAKIVMVPKPGKDTAEVSSYRPISLLPILSKVFERALMSKIQPELDRIIPDHQFGFRSRHGTVEKIHRSATVIGRTLDRRDYCSAAFLDVSQAFDRVWHVGLKSKIVEHLSSWSRGVLCSFLDGRQFRVCLGGCLTSVRRAYAGIPPGNCPWSCIVSTLYV